MLGVFTLVWLFARFLLPLFSPFLLGLLLALAAEPMVSFLHKRAHVPRAVSAGIGVSMTFSLLAMLILILCAFLVRQMRALAGVIPDLEQTAVSGAKVAQEWMLGLTDRSPDSIRPLLRQNITTLFSDGTALVDKGVRWLLGFAGNLLSHVPDSALSLGTSVIAGFMISAKLPRIRRWVRRRIPREKLRAMLAALHRVRQVLWSYLSAQAKLMGVTVTLLLAGFFLLRIPYAPLWALGVSVVDAFPVLGTGTVLLPWALVCFLQQDGGRAVGLLGLYALVSLTRSILEPRLLGRQLGLDPLVTLMALYAGYKLWGIGGMILAPMLAVTALRLSPSKP